MANPYTGSAIAGCNSPAVGADKSTYTGVFDTSAAAVDGHDHTTGKGNPISTNAISDSAITAAKLADDAVTTAKILDAQITLAKLAAATITSLLPPGMVVPYASAGSAPSGWLICDGSSVLRATYPNLFAAIGTIHGTADGTHFNLPDYRGRFLRGRDNGAANDPDAGARTAAATGGATGDAVGSVQGDATAKKGLSASSSTSYSAAHVTDVTIDLGSGYSGAGLSPLKPAAGGSNVGVTISGLATTTTLTGDNETRPKNAYVAYLIKV